jgi:diguanylate cyclase (GGDEF)-like protein/PAS domain S-box-containing protein
VRTLEQVRSGPSLFEVSPDAVCVADLDGRLQAINPSFEMTLGHSSDEVLGRCWVEWVHRGDRSPYSDMMRRLAAGETVTDVVLRHRHRDGGYRRLSWSAAPVLADGLVYASARDVTAATELEDTLRRVRRRIEALHRVTVDLEQGSDPQFREALRVATTAFEMDCAAISRVEGDVHRVLYHWAAAGSPVVPSDGRMARAFSALIGDAEGVVAIDRFEGSGLEGHPSQRELGLGSFLGLTIRRDGKPCATVGVASLRPRRTPWAADDREFMGLVASWIEATLERRESMRRLHLMARHDGLTGLLNRAAVLAGLEQAIQHSRRYGSSLCVLMMDIDRFKSINDERGHLTGDRVLAATGKVLRKSVRLADMAGRWGGDEFCLVMPETTVEGARVVAERLRGSIRLAEFQVDADSPVTASIGIARLTEWDLAEDVLARADAALYEAKREGRDRISVASTESEVPARGDSATGRASRRADRD